MTKPTHKPQPNQSEVIRFSRVDDEHYEIVVGENGFVAHEHQMKLLLAEWAAFMDGTPRRAFIEEITLA